MKPHVPNIRFRSLLVSHKKMFKSFSPIYVYVKQVILWAGPFLPHGNKFFNNFVKGSLDEPNNKGMDPLVSDKKI